MGARFFNFYRFSFYSLFFSSSLFANPSIEQIARGDVRIEQNGAQMTIYAPHKSIIDYHSFDIGQNEKVAFLQPSARSLVLNRIHSATPSQIDGTLTSNGILYLVNPAGIFFGKNSVVDVGGILAAAAHISEKDFLQNRDLFSQVSGEIIHQGILTSDSFVRFLGQKIVTQGEIVAKEDTSLFVSKDHLLFGPSDGHTFLVLQKEESASQIPLGSGDLFSLAIQHEGTIKASQVILQADENGKVDLLGKVDVSNVQGQRGGNIALLGSEVSLKGATIDAHGDLGGGEVYIGGSEHGKGPLPCASNVLVDGATAIYAQATQNGNGGKVIMYSNGDTRFEGAIDVGAGAKGGDGGFIEVSGKRNVFHNTDHINGFSPHGKLGLFFIDPNATLTIDDAYVNSPINTTLHNGLNFSVAATDLNVTTSFVNMGNVPGIPDSLTVTLTGTNSITFNNDAFATFKENLVFQTSGTLNFSAAFGGNIESVHLEFHGASFSWPGTSLAVFPNMNGHGDGLILFDIANPVTVSHIFCDQTGGPEPTGGHMKFVHDLNATTIRIFPTDYTITVGGVFNGGFDLSNMEFGNFNLHLLGGGTVTTANLHNVGALSLYGGVPNLVLPQNFTTDAPAVHTSGVINFGGTSNLAFSSIVVDGNTTFNNFGGFQTGAISASTPAFTLTVNGGNSQPGTFLGPVAIGGLTLNSLTSATFANNLILQNDLAITGVLTNVSVAGQTNAVNATINNTGGPAASVSLLGGGSITGTLSLTNINPLTLHATSGTPFTFGNGLPSVPLTHLQGPFIFTNASPISLQTLILDGDTTMQGSGGNVSVADTITPTTASLSIGTSGHSMGTTTFGGTITVNDFSVFASTATFAQDVTVHNYTSNATGTAHGNFIVNGIVQAAAFNADGVGKNVAFLNGGTFSGTATFTNTGTLDLFGSSTTPLTFAHSFDASVVPTTTVANSLIFLDSAPILTNNLLLNTNAAFQGAGGNVTISGTIAPSANNLSLGTSGHSMGAVSCAGTISLNDLSIFSSSTITLSSDVTVRNYTAQGATTASGNFTTNGVVQMDSFTANGAAKSIQLLHGGVIAGTTSFANNLSSITFGSSENDTLFLLEPLNLTGFAGTLTLTGALQTADQPIHLESGVGSFIIPTSASISSFLSAAGADVVFLSTIDGPGSLDVNAGSHLIQFFGSVGANTALSLLETTAQTTEIHTSFIHTGGGTMVFNGNTQLFVPTTLLDSGSTGIFFNGTLNGSFDLTLATFGAIAFLQDVGAIDPLGNVSIDFAIPVVFASSVTAEGNFFCKSFRQYSGRGDSSFVSMNTSIASGTVGGDINIFTEGTISFTGAITTKGGTSVGIEGFDGGDVTLTSTEASIEVAAIDTSGSDAIAGAGGNAGNVILQPSSNVDDGNLPDGKISLSGDITCLHGNGTPAGSDGDISLNPTGRDAPLAVATIYSKDTDGSITLTGKDLLIGTNDSLTTLGSFATNLSGTAQVGDIVTGNDLNLVANTIVVYKHLPSLILTSSGDLVNNPRVHFFAGGNVTHSHLLLQTGPGSTLETTSFQFSSAAREVFVDNLLFNNMVLNFFSNHSDNSLIFSSEPVQMANLLRVDWDLMGETLIDHLWIQVFDELGKVSSSWARTWRALLKEQKSLEVAIALSSSFSPKEFATKTVSSFEEQKALRYLFQLVDLMEAIEFSPHFSLLKRGEEKIQLQSKILQATCPKRLSLEEWKDLLQEISLVKHNAAKREAVS